MCLRTIHRNRRGWISETTMRKYELLFAVAVLLVVISSFVLGLFGYFGWAGWLIGSLLLVGETGLLLRLASVHRNSSYLLNRTRQLASDISSLSAATFDLQRKAPRALSGFSGRLADDNPTRSPESEENAGTRTQGLRELRGVAENGLCFAGDIDRLQRRIGIGTEDRAMVCPMPYNPWQGQEFSLLSEFETFLFDTETMTPEQGDVLRAVLCYGGDEHRVYLLRSENEEDWRRRLGNLIPFPLIYRESSELVQVTACPAR